MDDQEPESSNRNESQHEDPFFDPGFRHSGRLATREEL